MLQLYATAFFGNLFFERAIWVLYLTNQGYSLLQIGLLQSVLHATTVIFELPTGVLADLMGRKLSLVIGRSLIFLQLAGMIFADSFTLLAICFFFHGLGITFVSGAEEALLYDSHAQVGKDQSSSRLFGQYAAIITLSLALAMGLGGVLQRLSWEFVYGLSACCQLLSVGFSAFLREIPLTSQQPEKPRDLVGHIKDTLKFLRTHKAAGLLLAGVALYTGVISTYYMLAQELLSDSGLAVAVVSAVFAAESVVTSVMASKAYVVESWLSPKRTLRVALGVSILAFLILPVPRFEVGIIAFFVLSTVFSLFEPIASAALNQEIPSGQRATLMSVLSFFTSITMLLVFPLIGYLADRFELNQVLGAIGAGSMLTTFLMVQHFFSANKPRRTPTFAGANFDA